MNERIKQLNLQAMSIVMNGNDPDGDIEQMYIPSEFTKKFAELIVKECMDVAKDHTPETEECEYTWLIHDKIKEHFGVEE